VDLASSFTAAFLVFGLAESGVGSSAAPGLFTASMTISSLAPAAAASSGPWVFPASGALNWPFAGFVVVDRSRSLLPAVRRWRAFGASDCRCVVFSFLPRVLAEGILVLNLGIVFGRLRCWKTRGFRKEWRSCGYLSSYERKQESFAVGNGIAETKPCIHMH
jgi:hypothetical protein